jgi:hypothetical protein
MTLLTTAVPVTACPRCGKNNNMATAAFDPNSVPTEGDLSVCAYCKNIAVFRADQTLRAMTPREWATLPAEERKQLEAAQATLDQIGPPP